MEPGVSGMLVGNFKAIGILNEIQDDGSDSLRALDPDEFGITVDTQARTYTLDIAWSDLPESLVYSFSEYFGQHIVGEQNDNGQIVTIEWDQSRESDVIGSPEYPSSRDGLGVAMWAYYDLGLSYVSLGRWVRLFSVADETGGFTWDDDNSYEGEANAYYVYGQRTTDMPVTGTATYVGTAVMGSLGFSDAPSNGYHPIAATRLMMMNAPGMVFQADFADSTIASSINSQGEYQWWTSGTTIDSTTVSLNMAGSSTFDAAGAYSIPMSGYLTDINNDSDTAVAGSIDGAFFGPLAEQLGGTFQFEAAGSNGAILGSFIGEQIIGY